MSRKFEESRDSGAHAQLARLEGSWAGTSQVWFEPGDPVDTSEVQGRMRLVMGGRHVLHEYQSSFQGKPLEGLAIYAYNLTLQRYESAWIDSFHTGTFILFSEGSRGTHDMKMLGGYDYIAPDAEQHWGWRTEIEILNDDEVRITAYNISPEGGESKATEIAYRRQAGAAEGETA